MSIVDNCVFCKIVSGDIPSSKVYEDKDFLAFLDINPVNKGHTLLITKQHFETFNEVSQDLLSEFMVALQKISNAVNKASKSMGYNIFVNNHKVAGQEVPHVHFHILPRFEDDGVHFDLPTKKYAQGEMESIMQEISKFL